MKCRHCRAKAISCNFYGNEMKEPYLYQCTKSNCGTFFWHRSVLKEFNNKEKPDSDTNKTIEKDIIKKFKITHNDLLSMFSQNHPYYLF